MAWLAAAIINVWTTEKVTPAQLLGEDTESDVIRAEDFDSVEEFRAAVRARRKAMEEDD